MHWLTVWHAVTTSYAWLAAEYDYTDSRSADKKSLVAAAYCWLSREKHFMKSGVCGPVKSSASTNDVQMRLYLSLRIWHRTMQSETDRQVGNRTQWRARHVYSSSSNSFKWTLRRLSHNTFGSLFCWSEQKTKIRGNTFWQPVCMQTLHLFGQTTMYILRMYHVCTIAIVNTSKLYLSN